MISCSYLLRIINRREFLRNVRKCSTQKSINHDISYNDGSLMKRIELGLKASGKNLNKLNAADFFPVDQFHIGGIFSTKKIFDNIEILPGDQVLDVGCGLGGTARFLSLKQPLCNISGIDLTHEYIDVAKRLSSLVGISNISFQNESALSMSYKDESFDFAYLIHVGMNIQDKRRLFQEISRVLKPNGKLIIFDMMLGNEKNEIHFPVPWASSLNHSYVDKVDIYLDSAKLAGFNVVEIEDHYDFIQKVLDNSITKLELNNDDPPIFSQLTTFGLDAKLKMKNLISLLNSRTISPTVIKFMKSA